jgi:hypothetical protein
LVSTIVKFEYVSRCARLVAGLPTMRAAAVLDAAAFFFFAARDGPELIATAKAAAVITDNEIRFMAPPS